MALKVNIGDLIQYRYRAGMLTYRDARFVTMIDNLGFWVQGGFHVKPSDVIAVMHESEAETRNSELETATTREFPLEKGQ